MLGPIVVRLAKVRHVISSALCGWPLSSCDVLSGGGAYLLSDGVYLKHKHHPIIILHHHGATRFLQTSQTIRTARIC